MTEATASTHSQSNGSDESLTIGRMDQGSVRRGSGGWWGMMTLIATEACLFGYLLFSYYYMLLQEGRDFLPPEMPSFRLSGPNTVLLLLSSVAVWYGEHSIKRSHSGRAVVGFGTGFVMGAVFVGVQVREWMEKPYSLDSDPHGSLFFTVTGFHMAHVVVGLLVLGALILWTALGKFDAERHAPVSIGGIYWHFVDAVWLTVFFSFYLAPYFW